MDNLYRIPLYYYLFIMEIEKCSQTCRRVLSLMPQPWMVFTIGSATWHNAISAVYAPNLRPIKGFVDHSIPNRMWIAMVIKLQKYCPFLQHYDASFVLRVAIVLRHVLGHCLSCQWARPGQVVCGLLPLSIQQLDIGHIDLGRDGYVTSGHPIQTMWHWDW